MLGEPCPLCAVPMACFNSDCGNDATCPWIDCWDCSSALFYDLNVGTVATNFELLNSLDGGGKAG